MNRITLDKVASATKNAGVETEVYISDDIVSKDGYILAVKILSDKAVYNTLENAHGRMMRLKPGDVIAGVIGRRRGLYGYSGEVPEVLIPGDTINVLNPGGVLGRCTSYAPNVGEPFEAKVLGAILSFPVLGERIGEPAHIASNTIPKAGSVENSAPLVAVVGTSMNAGKTVASGQIIHGLTKQGFKVAAAKVTGVSLERDILSMKDAGAIQVLSFNDAGYVSTNQETAPDATRRIVTELNRGKPDVIILELGDGLLGEYGVQAVLKDKAVVQHVAAVVLSANDQVGVAGAIPLLSNNYNLDISVVTGPVSDNEVGIRCVEKVLGIPAKNALTAPKALADHILKEVFPK